MVSRRLLDGGGRRKCAERRGSYPADSLWERMVPQRVWQSQRGIHVARLLRISGFVADNPGALRRKRVFNTEANLGLFSQCGGAGIAREDSRRHTFQRGGVGWA